MAIFDKVKGAWNAFRSTEQAAVSFNVSGLGSTQRPDRAPARYSSERSIVSSIYTRIGIDVAGVGIRHIKLDEAKRYSDDAESQLNDCMTIEPNLDQGPRAFRQDIVRTLFDHGSVAIVPVDTTVDPRTNEIFDIHTLRAGNIIEWHPKHVRVKLWNEVKGSFQEVLLEKRFVAIVENPLFSVMNEQNSTLQRLIRKLNLLDVVDEANSSGKLDMIIQLPYVIKSEARKQQAEQRREDIEFQLRSSKYGIAYTDGTEKITQLNRPVENTLMPQIEYLVNMLYGQLGITEEVMNGTADESAMINYFNRTIEPILDAITEAMSRTFLGRKGLKRGERIMFFRDPFKLMPLSVFAEVADKLNRNEIFTANELRGYIGAQPSLDPKADQLMNSNINPHGAGGAVTENVDGDGVHEAAMAGLDELDSAITEAFSELGVSEDAPG